ncbi:MAG: phosphate starvation-inducible protein PhoH, partial [Clostridia bacterium]|nr:phosphate starvation-inducible protein PhoH [Clostridia bacterium]
MFEQTISIERIEHIVNLFGNFDENIKEIEKEFGVRISTHSSEIKIKGDTENVLLAVRVIKGLLTLLDKGEAIT